MVKLQSVSIQSDREEIFTFLQRKKEKEEQQTGFNTGKKKPKDYKEDISEKKSVLTFGKLRESMENEIDSDKEDTEILLACLNKERQYSEQNLMAASFKDSCAKSNKKIRKFRKSTLFESALNDSIDNAIITKVKNRCFRSKNKKFINSKLFLTTRNVLTQHYFFEYKVSNVFKTD